MSVPILQVFGRCICGPTARQGTRAIHFLGDWVLLLAAIALRHWWWIGIALAGSYALAWVSHFFVEHNRPASFEHPLWSWLADQKMVALMLARRNARRSPPLHGGELTL